MSTLTSRAFKPRWPFSLNRDSDQAQGLVGWWPGSPHGGARLFDMSGKGNHGTLTNFAAPFTNTSGWVSGKDGGSGALAFDGTNDYVKPAHAINLTTWSLSAWVNVTNFADYRVIVNSCGANNALRNFEMDCAITTGRVDVGFTQGQDNFKNLSSTKAVTAGVWTHIGGSYDGSVLSVVYNGLVDATTTSYSGNADTATQIYIGSVFNNSTFFIGKMESLAIWNRVLKASEWASLYEPSTRWQLRYQPGRRSWFTVTAAAGGASIFRGGILRSRTIAGGAA